MVGFFDSFPALLTNYLLLDYAYGQERLRSAITILTNTDDERRLTRTSQARVTLASAFLLLPTSGTKKRALGCNWYMYDKLSFSFLLHKQ